MARNMSFAITTEQVRMRTKTVTRRKGWAFVEPGDIVTACVKCMGLKKGEKIERLCTIKIVSVRPERLDAIKSQGIEECAREGFPDMTPEEFITKFLQFNSGPAGQMVNRIEFEYCDDVED